MRGKRRRRRRRKAGRSPSKKKREIEGGSQLLWQLHTSQHYSLDGNALCSYPPHVLDPFRRLARCSSYRRRASKKHTFVSYAPSEYRTTSRTRWKSLPREKTFRSGRDRIRLPAHVHVPPAVHVIDGQMHAAWSDKHIIGERLSNMWSLSNCTN